MDIDATPSLNQEPDSEDWSVRLHGRIVGSIPPNATVSLDVPYTVHVIAHSHAMLEDYDRRLDAAAYVWRRYLPAGHRYTDLNEARSYLTKRVDEVIADLWGSKVRVVDVVLPFGYAMVFHGHLIHAGAEGEPGQHAWRLFLNFNHKYGPRYHSNPEDTFTVPFCKSGLLTARISQMLERLMVQQR